MVRTRRNSNKNSQVPTQTETQMAETAEASPSQTEVNESVEQPALTLASLTEAVETQAAPALPVPPAQPSTDPRRRSLSIAEIISLAAIKTRPATQGQQHASAATAAAVNNLNLPESLRSGLLKADSPILNALLPLIRQKLAAKTAEVVAARRASVDDASPSLSTSSRRSSTSSRSDDHRNSHKLAERKRRREMKDVFDALRDSLPPGARKSSKWEILMEAADEIDRLLAMENELLRRRERLLSTLKQP